MKYKVKIIETFEKEVEIEAANEREAHDKAENMWFNGDLKPAKPANLTDHEIYILNQKQER